MAAAEGVWDLKKNRREELYVACSPTLPSLTLPSLTLNFWLCYFLAFTAAASMGRHAL